jgi:hypothetical protein
VCAQQGVLKGLVGGLRVFCLERIGRDCEYCEYGEYSEGR